MFLLDTANIQNISSFIEMIPLEGVTSNPSIIKKEGQIDFFKHMRQIREIIGSERDLHIQVSSNNYEEIIEDAKRIVKEIDKDVYIKIPVDAEGLKAISTLKGLGYKVTATAVYTKFQAYLAIESQADYIAPYYNRCKNLNIDPDNLINEVSQYILRSGSSTKILGASYKNIEQVNKSIHSGADFVTLDPELYEAGLSIPSIQKAKEDFKKDWESIYHQKNISNL